MSGSNARPLRRTGSAWLVMGAVGLAMLVAGGRGTDRESTSPERARSIAAQLRCLQCDGESVAESSADIAVDMRDEIADQLDAGRTDDEILTYFADRYQREVLLVPPTNGAGAVVWVLPLFGAALAVGGLWWRLDRTRDVPGTSEVSPSDREAVERARRRRHARSSR